MAPKATQDDLGPVHALLSLHKLKGRLKVPRRTHTKQDTEAMLEFRENLAQKLLQLVGQEGKVRVWVADEHRYGLLPVVRRCWGLKGVRVKAPYATRYEWGYLHSALEIDGANKSVFLILPTVNKEVSRMFLEEISQVDPEALHIVIWDGAGFHPRDGEEGVSNNVRLLGVPAYSPELNPVEGVGDELKDTFANELYTRIEDIECVLVAKLQEWLQESERVGRRIFDWMKVQANSSESKS